MGNQISKEKANGIVKKAGWLSIIGNVLLFIIKLWVGLISSSIALISDAVHTLSDSMSSIVVLVALKIANKPPDKEHPFGHGRADLIATIIVGVMLSIVAFEFLLKSGSAIINKESTEFGFWAIVVTIFSILAKEGMAQYSMHAYRKSGKTSMKSDAWHHRSDAISSFIILLGIFLNTYFWWIDGVLGLIVAVFIGKTSYDIIKQPIEMLLGEMPSDKLIGKLETEAFDLLGFDANLHAYKIHRYGDHIELSCHIELSSDASFMRAHDIATLIENLFFKKFDIHATIHFEPTGYNQGLESEYFTEKSKLI
ncbi:MAG: cation transporter [Bacteroidales bacterium]|nr:cation transporter [Bacteroidales bacterium]